MVTGRGRTSSANPCKKKKKDLIEKFLCLLFVFVPLFFKRASKRTIVCFQSLSCNDTVSVESVVSVQQTSAAT